MDGPLHRVRLRRPRRVHHRQLLVQEAARQGGSQVREDPQKNIFKSNCVMTCHLLIYRVRYLENGKIQRVSTYKAKGSAVPVWLPTEQRRVKCSINRPCLHACVLALGSSLSSSAGRRRRWKDKRIGAGKGRALLLLSRNERSHAPNLLPRWLPAIGESKRRWKRRIDKRKVHVG